MEFDVRDTRNSNWLWMRRELVREDGDELGAYGIAVYATLASYADESNTAYPSLGSVADMIGCSRRQVQREIKTLKSLGWIGYEKRSEDSGGYTSHLFYLLECPYDSQSDGGVTDSLPPSDSQSHKVERKEVSHSNSAGARDSDAVQAYEDVFPRQLKPNQAEEVHENVDDIDLWRAVLKWWNMNGYRAKSVGRMLNKYRQTDGEADLYQTRGDGAPSQSEHVYSKPTNGKAATR